MELEGEPGRCQCTISLAGPREDRIPNPNDVGFKLIDKNVGSISLRFFRVLVQQLGLSRWCLMRYSDSQNEGLTLFRKSSTLSKETFPRGNRLSPIQT